MCTVLLHTPPPVSKAAAKPSGDGAADAAVMAAPAILPDTTPAGERAADGEPAARACETSGGNGGDGGAASSDGGTGGGAEGRTGGSDENEDGLPLVLWFHGGGYTVGSERDAYGPLLSISLLAAGID